MSRSRNLLQKQLSGQLRTKPWVEGVQAVVHVDVVAVVVDAWVEA